jgi:hypothetical protein
MALEQEVRYFESRLGEWLALYKGQFAVVKEDQLMGTFTKFEEAFDAGVQLYGTQSFLIRQIDRKQPVAQYPALVLGLLSAHP